MKNWKVAIEIVFTIVLILNMTFLLPINSKIKKNDTSVGKLFEITNRLSLTDEKLIGMVNLANNEQSHNIEKFNDIAEDIKAIRDLIEQMRKRSDTE